MVNHRTHDHYKDWAPCLRLRVISIISANDDVCSVASTTLFVRQSITASVFQNDRRSLLKIDIYRPYGTRCARPAGSGTPLDWPRGKPSLLQRLALCRLFVLVRSAGSPSQRLGGSGCSNLPRAVTTETGRIEPFFLGTGTIRPL